MHDTIKLDIFIFTWWYALNLIIRIVICQLLLNTLGNSVQDTRTSKSYIEHVFLCHFPATLQPHNSPGDYAKELFKC